MALQAIMEVQEIFDEIGGGTEATKISYRDAQQK